MRKRSWIDRELLERLRSRVRSGEAFRQEYMNEVPAQEGRPGEERLLAGREYKQDVYAEAERAGKKVTLTSGRAREKSTTLVTPGETGLRREDREWRKLLDKTLDALGENPGKASSHVPPADRAAAQQYINSHIVKGPQSGDTNINVAKQPQVGNTNSHTIWCCKTVGTNFNVAKQSSSGSIVLKSEKTQPMVTIIVEIGPAHCRGTHTLPWTGRDLRTYAHQIPSAASVFPRGKIFTHKPVFKGPQRLWYVPRPGEVLIVHGAQWSAARHLGQRQVLDSEAASRLKAIAQETIVERATPQRLPAGKTIPGAERVFTKLFGS